MTEDFFLLRAAARFGQDPCTWIDSLTPGMRRQLIGFEIVEHAIEARHLALAASRG